MTTKLADVRLSIGDLVRNRRTGEVWIYVAGSGGDVHLVRSRIEYDRRFQQDYELVRHHESSSWDERAPTETGAG
jgi:hypothetical protein